MDARQNNAEIVTRFLNLLSDEGLPGVAAEVEALWHPDMEWTPGMLDYGKPTYRGWAECREYLEKVEDGRMKSARSFVSHAAAEEAANA